MVKGMSMKFERNQENKEDVATKKLETQVNLNDSDKKKFVIESLQSIINVCETGDKRVSAHSIVRPRQKAYSRRQPRLQLVPKDNKTNDQSDHKKSNRDAKSIIERFENNN